MSDLLAPLRLFVRVARTGSFSRAGRELAISQPSASRIIAALEREVGAPLLTRTTRAVVLTEAGSEYLGRVEPLLDALEEANQAARGTGELRGVLRLALPISIAAREIIPRLPRFLSRHPALRMDLLLDDGRQDLVREGVDVALRFGELTDSSGTARFIGMNQRLLAAAPANRPRPRSSPIMHSSSDRPGRRQQDGRSSARAVPSPCASRAGSLSPSTKARLPLRWPDWALFRPGFGDVARSWRAARSSVSSKIGACLRKRSTPYFPPGAGRSDRRGLSSIS